jgi:hypothetical protein
MRFICIAYKKVLRLRIAHDDLSQTNFKLINNILILIIQKIGVNILQFKQKNTQERARNQICLYRIPKRSVVATAISLTVSFYGISYRALSQDRTQTPSNIPLISVWQFTETSYTQRRTLWNSDLLCLVTSGCFNFCCSLQN